MCPKKGFAKIHITKNSYLVNEMVLNTERDQKVQRIPKKSKKGHMVYEWSLI